MELSSRSRTAARPAVAVLGGDESGLESAAVMLAGHLPYVWDQKGPTTDKIADEVKQFLAGKGVTSLSAASTAVYVRVERARAADRLDRRRCRWPTAASSIKAMVALNQFKATSARDPKRPLSYANVRALQIRLRAPGSAPVSVDLPRAAAPEPAVAAAAGAPARRRREGELRSLDLLRQRGRARRLGQQPDSRIASTSC